MGESRTRRARDVAPAGGRRATIATLALGALLLAGAVALTLANAGPRRTGTNDVVPSQVVASLSGSHRICQDERLPADTDVLRVSLASASAPPPRARVTVATREGPIASDRVAWDSDQATVVLGSRLARDVDGRICFSLGSRASQATTDVTAGAVEGTGMTIDETPSQALLRIEYVDSRAQTWWAFLPTVVERIGRGHAWSGSSVALVVVLLTVLSIALASWQLARTSE